MVSREVIASASRARARRVKDQLLKMFPSFREEIDRLRIRHHIEMIPGLLSDDPHIGAGDVRAAVSNASGTDLLISAERYIARHMGKGVFFSKRTYATTYFPSVWEHGLALRDSDVHEFAHYLTHLAARQLYGRTGPHRVPVGVHEGIAFAFQDKYLQENPNLRRRIDPDLVIAIYSRDPRFNGSDFRSAFDEMRRVLRHSDYDAAARKIPDVLRKVVGEPRRKLLKRR